MTDRDYLRYLYSVVNSCTGDIYYAVKYEDENTRNAIGVELEIIESCLVQVKDHLENREELNPYLVAFCWEALRYMDNPHIRDCISGSYDEVLEVLDHGEYGLAWDLIVSVLPEEELRRACPFYDAVVEVMREEDE